VKDENNVDLVVIDKDLCIFPLDIDRIR